MQPAATPIHTRLSSVLALVATIALLAAPICAPLCAGKICASTMRSSETRYESCHEMAGVAENGADQYFATNKTCGATDFSAVLVTADKQSLLSQVARSNFAPVLLANSPALPLQNLRATPGRWRVHRVPLKSRDFLPLNTILRI